MFGGASKPDSDSKSDDKSPSPEPSPTAASAVPINNADQVASGEKRSGNGSPPTRQDVGEKKRRSSGVGSKASSLLASARNSLNFSQATRSGSDSGAQTLLQKLGKHDPALGVPQGQHNNSAGESAPGPKSTFYVGVCEERNRRHRRTMEDTHSFLKDDKDVAVSESDNGYFAIFDGHAGSFAADWCGKKLHIVLEEMIRKHPSMPIPELLDMTFTSVDSQLEKLQYQSKRISGCTAAVALKGLSSRQRVLYTANVGDARIVLCRNGKALRLSYDHKSSDENEKKRIANAGGKVEGYRVGGLAVSRALGDHLMKKLVTGHPYTTETVIQHDLDEFIIIACDGLWDVCSDQEAVDLVREIHDPGEGAKILVDHALDQFSTDNLSCMVVRLDKEALARSQASQDAEPEANHGAASKVSEADKIVMDTKQKIADGQTPAVGVSASNSANEGDFVPTTLSDALVEEPIAIEDSDSPELISLDTSIGKPAAAAAQESKDESKELADV
ncbi:hypothetical protein TRIATDRAFT_128623 [Trichoderma atroviride IMI 206040]|uniref:PPM-type phosphatase domain-containing protein n=1 Tax=Hypocrea atroviridis (strain ATCC 20476 / IMI 206040) TaxID=452589 RepID=G9NRD9_HYPAI|nr:uncharacterized protein TRIATDRAFT_128623 [Trichoderma atroviride IMI 206040]EHK46802.1 hypothetical protein TRIATDRAFT_128623 [Trichoderma atroviride IMI 206040]